MFTLRSLAYVSCCVSCMFLSFYVSWLRIPQFLQFSYMFSFCSFALVCPVCALISFYVCFLLHFLVFASLSLYICWRLHLLMCTCFGPVHCLTFALLVFKFVCLTLPTQPSVKKIIIYIIWNAEGMPSRTALPLPTRE